MDKVAESVVPLKDFFDALHQEDYAKVKEIQQQVSLAEKEADIILWDGGNNDMSFYKPDLAIVVTDPHRPGHELAYYPGETNLIMADVVIINKVDTADHQGVETVRNNIKAVNPGAVIIEGASPITVEDSDLITGKKVLVVEDGPTLTHGEMKIGAGMVAAEKFNTNLCI